MPLFFMLLIALISVPLVELYVLLNVGRAIGAGTTVFLVIFTAVLGAWLLRLQGLATIERVRHALAAGEIPTEEVIGGFILLAAGAMLLTPGFITDTLGFLCLVPAIRRAIAGAFARRMVTQVRRPPGAHGTVYESRTIEADYRVEDDDDERPRIP